jgi:hypothetical protein
MGYFDGLASAIIKKDKSNNSVYYPWGVLGKGYVLENEAKELAIKKMVILFYQLFFGVFALFFIVFRNPLIFGVCTLALVAWFLYKSHQLTKNCPKSDEKLTLKEGYSNSAKAHNLWVLYILLAVSIMFTVLGLLLLISGKVIGAALFLTVLFGAASAAFIYMIRVKNQQAKQQT